jgi:hypothetical protein
MPEEEMGMELEELVSSDDLELLRAEADRRGMTLAEMAKHGIQTEFTRRTKPRSMQGTIQAFRRRTD